MILTPEIRAIPVCYEMFVSSQHHAAWKAGDPLRTHRKRWKIAPEVRELVKRECRYKCKGCGKPDYLTIEHIIPVVLGGSNHQRNLSLLCTACQAVSWARFRDVLKAVDDAAA